MNQKQQSINQKPLINQQQLIYYKSYWLIKNKIDGGKIVNNRSTLELKY